METTPMRDVKICQDINETLKVAQARFPNLSRGQQLRAQFRTELVAANLPAWSIGTMTVCDGVATYMVTFTTIDHATLQAAFDNHIIQGTFKILT
jgi:hypothetical protein